MRKFIPLLFFLITSMHQGVAQFNVEGMDWFRVIGQCFTNQEIRDVARDPNFIVQDPNKYQNVGFIWNFTEGFALKFESWSDCKRLATVSLLHKELWPDNLKELAAGSNKPIQTYSKKIPFGLELDNPSSAHITNVLGSIIISRDRQSVAGIIEVKPIDIPWLTIDMSRGLNIGGFERFSINWNYDEWRRYKDKEVPFYTDLTAYDWNSFDLKEHVKTDLIDQKFMSAYSLRKFTDLAMEYNSNKRGSDKYEFFFFEKLSEKIDLDRRRDASFYQRVWRADTIVIKRNVNFIEEVSIIKNIEHYQYKEHLVAEYKEHFMEVMGKKNKEFSHWSATEKDPRERYWSEDYTEVPISDRETRYLPYDEQSTFESLQNSLFFRVYVTETNLVISAVMENYQALDGNVGTNWLNLLGGKLNKNGVDSNINSLTKAHNGSIKVNGDVKNIYLHDIGVEMSAYRNEIVSITFFRTEEEAPTSHKKYMGIYPFGFDNAYDAEGYGRDKLRWALSNYQEKIGAVKFELDSEKLRFSLSGDPASINKWKRLRKKRMSMSYYSPPEQEIFQQLDMFGDR